MSDQQKEQDRAERAVRTRDSGQAAGAGPAVAEPASGPIDSAATAALALAVTSAKRAASSPSQARQSGERTVDRTAAPPGNREWRATLRRLCGGLLLALAAGWFGAQLLSPARKADPHWAAAAEVLRGTQEDVVRVTGDVRALKVSLEALKDGLDRSRTETHAKQTHVIEAIGRLERAIAISRSSTG